MKVSPCLLLVTVGLGPLVASSSSGPAPDTIRVAIVEQTRAAELRGVGIEVSDLGGCDQCPRDDWRTDTVRARVAGTSIEIDGYRARGFRLRSEHPILLNRREYPAVIDLVRNGDGIMIVNDLPLEEYLVGVVRAESGDRWPPEALRAQAIVSRTYAAYQRLISVAKPYDIVASTAHQQYIGRVASNSPAWTAVRETAGQVLRWEGELFPAFFHTESGGYTEDPRTVFAARNMLSLRPVVCPFSAGSPHFYWHLDLRLADVSAILRRNNVAVGDVVAIEVTERTPSLRAAVVTVRGARGTARLRGNDFRRMIGYDSLKSTLFAVVLDGGMARFAGRGYGHGVGLCQWGAKGMAEQGYAASQILAFYYPGAALGYLNER